MEALNNDVDELFNTSKLYHVITSHNMKRTQEQTKEKLEKKIVDVEDYIEKANEELKDENYYKKNQP